MALDSHGRRELLSAFGIASIASLTRGWPFVLKAGAETVPAGTGLESGSEYLIDPGLTYLNTASLGPTPRVVLDRTVEAWHLLESNPVRMSYENGAVHVATDQVREKAAAFLGCTADALILTRSTTDAMNHLALGTHLRPGDRVLTTNQEHEGGTHGWQYVARRHGVAVDVLELPTSDHDALSIVRRIAAAITPATRIISVSHVLTSNGLRMPIAEIAALARSQDILCVVDGAQAIGQIEVDVKKLECHAYAASGHKWLMGPKGTGFLYISRDAAARMEPIQREAGNRYVSNSTGIGCLPLVIGLGAAIDLMTGRGMAAVEKRIRELRSHVLAGMQKIRKLRVVSPPDGTGATALVACMLPDDVDSGVFHPMLREKHGVIVKRAEPRFFNGLRLSAHLFNTEEEIDRALDVIRAELG